MPKSLPSDIISELIGFFEWVFEDSYNDENKCLLARKIQEEWADSSAEERQNMLQFLAVYRGLAYVVEEEEQKGIHKYYKEVVLSRMQSNDRPMWKWLQSFYDAASTTEPFIPDTQQSVDLQSEATADYMNSIERFNRVQKILDFGWKRF
jgi:hypothetical protein